MDLKYNFFLFHKIFFIFIIENPPRIFPLIFSPLYGYSNCLSSVLKLSPSPAFDQVLLIRILINSDANKT